MLFPSDIAITTAGASTSIESILQPVSALLIDASSSAIAANGDTATLAAANAIIDATDVASTTVEAITASDIDSTATASTVATTSASTFSTQYAFMFPTMTCIAILCQSAGIGGAALLSPIFLLVFPLLGYTQVFPSAASAIACALLTECFGFASGLSGYWKRGLVDWDVAFKFLRYSLPAAFFGAIIEPSLASETTLLRGVYSVLMVTLCLYLLLSEKPDKVPDECFVSVNDVNNDDSINEDNERTMTNIRSHSSSDGAIYTYLEPSSRQNWKTTTATLGGASLTGLLGVGMGEVILPQLVRRACMPLPVAAGTSVAVVVLTALTAAIIQFLALAHDISNDIPEISILQGFIQVIPWNLVQYTIPGAMLGGQIAPYLASKQVLDEDVVEQIVAILFGIIGIAFAVKCIAG